MAAIKWKPFPHSAKDYAYEGAALKSAWPELHRGDCEPFPDAAFVKQAFARHPRLRRTLDAEKTAVALQSAWRAFIAASLAQRSRKERRSGRSAPMQPTRPPTSMRPIWRRTASANAEILLRSAERAEALQAAAPDFPNAFYFHAQALGRYAQEISIVKALAQGIGGKVKASLDKTIKLEPKHAEAHIALGAYHAEIVSKVGGMLAGLTYGASREEAVRQFALARKLLPDSAIARIEEANGLVMLFGKAKLAEAQKLYKEAAHCAPADAMQKLVEHAKEEG